MNIIQVTPGYPPSVGGVQNVAKEVSESLASKGHNVVVYCPDYNSEYLPSQKNLTISYLKTYVIGHTPIMPTLFFKLLFASKNSIIHLHVSRAFLPEVVWLVSIIRKIPYVAHYHLDIGPSGKLGFMLPGYKKVFLSIVLKKACQVVVLSPYYKKVVKDKYGISDSVVFIPNGVANKFFTARKWKKSKVTRLLFVGRLSVQKNVECLIRCLPYIKNKVVLDIVGHGENLVDIKKLITKYKLKNVVLHGVKTGNKLIDLYLKSDIFVLSSRQEGMSLSLLEASAAGLPIVVSDVLGNREFAKDTGVLVNPPIPKNFAKEIDSLINDPIKIRTLSKKSVEKAKNYKWSEITDRLLEVYKKCG